MKLETQANLEISPDFDILFNLENSVLTWKPANDFRNEIPFPNSELCFQVQKELSKLISMFPSKFVFSTLLMFPSFEIIVPTWNSKFNIAKYLILI